MSTAENKTIVRRLLEDGFNAGNFAVFDELLAPDFVNHDPANPTARDRDGLKQYWAALCAGFPDQHTVAEELLADGDKVVKRAAFRATHTGTFNGLPPTGKQVTNASISIYRIVDGRITAIWWGYDNLGVLQQLGVIPQAQAEPVGV